MPGINLPGGRGEMLGENAGNLQPQLYDLRQATLPKTNGLIFPFYRDARHLNNAPGAGKEIFQFVGYPDRIYRLTKARVVLVTASAGGTWKFGLYLGNLGTKELTLLPGSDVTFSTSAPTGLLEVSLPQPIEIHPDMLLWLGSIRGDTTMIVSAMPTYGHAYKNYVLDPQTSLIDKVKFASLTANTNATQPMMSYLSAEAAEVL